MRIPLCILPLAAAGLVLAGCGHTTGERVATGALGGAAIGAVVDGGSGALIGAGAGAVGGAVVDANAKDHGR